MSEKYKEMRINARIKIEVIDVTELLDSIEPQDIIDYVINKELIAPISLVKKNQNEL